MFSDDEIVRLKSIAKKIDDIYAIIERHGGIVKALEEFGRTTCYFNAYCRHIRAV